MVKILEKIRTPMYCKFLLLPSTLWATMSKTNLNELRNLLTMLRTNLNEDALYESVDDAFIAIKGTFLYTASLRFLKKSQQVLSLVAEWFMNKRIGEYFCWSLWKQLRSKEATWSKSENFRKRKKILCINFV